MGRRGSSAEAQNGPEPPCCQLLALRSWCSGELEAELAPGDRLTFISTLHGG